MKKKKEKKPRQVLEVDGEAETMKEGLGRERKVRLGRISWNHLAALGQGATVVTLKYNLPKSHKKTPRESDSRATGQYKQNNTNPWFWRASKSEQGWEPISHISCPD